MVWNDNGNEAELNTAAINKASTHQRIIYTAHNLFYRNGIRATGIDRIIAESHVSKVTFYRHFPSKNDLIHAFLEDRHQSWMAWFTEALQRHGAGVNALVPTLAEWFRSDGFRGCAFINSVVELGGDLPEIVGIAGRHKNEMTGIIAGLLPAAEPRERQAQAIALAVDGAIIRAQFDDTPDTALAALGMIIKSIVSDGMPVSRESTGDPP